MHYLRFYDELFAEILHKDPSFLQVGVSNAGGLVGACGWHARLAEAPQENDCDPGHRCAYQSLKEG